MCELHALFVAACICLAFGFLEEFDAVRCRVYGLEFGSLFQFEPVIGNRDADLPDGIVFDVIHVEDEDVRIFRGRIPSSSGWAPIAFFV